MAGKKSAKETIAEWEARQRANVADAGSAVQGGIDAVGKGVGAATDVAKAVGSAAGGITDEMKFQAQQLGIAEKDIPYYLEQLQRQAPGAGQAIGEFAAGAKGAMNGLLDSASSAYQSANPGKVPVRNLNTPYDIQMQGMDMQSTPETQAYWADVARSANASPAQKVGGLLGSGLDAATGAIPAIKGIGQQFMQGLQGASPVDQAQQQMGQSEAQLQKIWESMTPVEKEMFLQELQARKQGGTP